MAANPNIDRLIAAALGGCERALDQLLTRATARARRVAFSAGSMEVEDVVLAATSDRDPGVRAALSRLPRSHQDLIRARYVAGELYLETGRRLGVTTSAVKSRLHRARKLLMKELNTMNAQLPIHLTADDRLDRRGGGERVLEGFQAHPGFGVRNRVAVCRVREG